MSVILIGPNDATDIISVEHPRTSRLCQFIVTESDKLYELVTLANSRPQSVLLEDEIIETCPIWLATEFDVSFLLIAGLSKQGNSQRYLELDDLLEPFPTRLKHLLQAVLTTTCESIDGADKDQFWRLSQIKADNYIQARISKVQDKLPPSILDGLTTASAELNLLARQKAAFELVGSYLPPVIATRILELYDFSKLSEHLSSLKSDVIDPNDFIKRKGDIDEASTAAKKLKKGSKGVETLKKVNTKGMKSMTSFFAKKEKV